MIRFCSAICRKPDCDELVGLVELPFNHQAVFADTHQRYSCDIVSINAIRSD
jgi:hypothetical protein